MVIPVSIDIVFAISMQYDLREWIVKIFSLDCSGIFIVIWKGLKFEQKLDRLDADDEFYPALLESITQTKNEKLEAIDGLFSNKKKKNKAFNLILIIKG